MKPYTNIITGKKWFGTTKNIDESNHRVLCQEYLLEYFDIPKGAKEIWLKVFSQPTKNSYGVKRIVGLSSTTVGICTADNEYIEEVDSDLIKDFEDYKEVHVEVRFST